MYATAQTSIERYRILNTGYASQVKSRKPASDSGTDATPLQVLLAGRHHQGECSCHPPELQ